jgi:hypothetical protein
MSDPVVEPFKGEHSSQPVTDMGLRLEQIAWVVLIFITFAEELTAKSHAIQSDVRLGLLHE